MAQLCAAGGSPSTGALQTGLKGGNTGMQKAVLSFNYHSSGSPVSLSKSRGHNMASISLACSMGIWSALKV